MKLAIIGVVLGLCLGGSVVVGLPAQSGSVSIIDGDTLDLDGTRFRLNGIDAPERAQTCKTSTGKIWRCGAAATQALVALTKNATVTCKSHGTDHYNRQIATCFADDHDVGRALVKRGYAWAFLKFSDTYAGEQTRAKAQKLGIWQGSAQPAWEFRAASWSSARQKAPADCPIKGNISDNGRIYHTPWSKWYSRTKINTAKGERWFCNEAEAIAAGWKAAS